jgi:hypothetical protein
MRVQSEGEVAAGLARRLATGSWLRAGRLANMRDFRISIIHLHFEV